MWSEMMLTWSAFAPIFKPILPSGWRTRRTLHPFRRGRPTCLHWSAELGRTHRCAPTRMPMQPRYSHSPKKQNESAHLPQKLRTCYPISYRTISNNTMPIALLIDFGSTYTKVDAVDLATDRFLGRTQAPSTVDTDVTQGLFRALNLLKEQTGLRDEQMTLKLTCSSAAGGLRMVAIGLIGRLTAEAAHRGGTGVGHARHHTPGGWRGRWQPRGHCA
ncbi:MAG: hypothetical protein EXR53_05490 [Dehalococcoidia bacterium]|nr:hypothetical protein [Dehalococcoidia bacterium]